MEAVAGDEVALGRGPQRDVVDVDDPDAARLRRLAKDAVVRPDARGLRLRVAVVGTGRSHRVVGRRDNENATGPDAADELVQDQGHIASVRVRGHASYD